MSEQLTLRQYQQECIDTIMKKPPGSYLVQMATGLGKTVTFANIPRRGRTLILSHREELVEQPRKYFNCSFGIERARKHSNGEEVISASIQTLVKRLDRFPADTFDMIIVDEAHHSSAKTYRKILQYFNSRLTVGFTATPNRADRVRLDDIFSEIIFARDLRWGIENGYLTEIFCKRVKIACDLRAIHSRMGDYAPGELEKAMEGTADAIAQAYREHAEGPTIIFAVSVQRAEEIAARIPGSAVVTGATKDRAAIIQRFAAGEIPAIVNCMVFTEGTDIPCIKTCIMARPTKSDSLYTQCVGRALRPFPGKDKAILIDCVGITGKASLCTAPSLLGIDIDSVPEEDREKVEGNLFELPKKIAALSDRPESWIRNVEIVNLWAKEKSYNLHDINFFRHPDGAMSVSVPGAVHTIPAPDLLGRVLLKDGTYKSMQECIDLMLAHLMFQHADSQQIWDLRKAEQWGRKPASELQLKKVRKLCKDFNTDGLTKLQASQIISRVQYKNGQGQNILE